MGFASFLLGYLDGGTIQHTFSSAMESKYFGFYAQDDWKVTNKLTLNIGLRWDVDLPRTERYNRLNYWDITADSPINGKVTNLPGRTLKGAMRFVDSNYRHQATTDKNNWGPRFGFVYAINNATVFRGSYGIIYSPSV